MTTILTFLIHRLTTSRSRQHGCDGLDGCGHRLCYGAADGIAFSLVLRMIGAVRKSDAFAYLVGIVLAAIMFI